MKIKFKTKAIELPEELLEGNSQFLILKAVMEVLWAKDEDQMMRKVFLNNWLKRNREKVTTVRQYCKHNGIQLKKARSKPIAD